MSGNVWKWCYDWYGSVSTGDVTDPTGASSDSCRILRGGSWYCGFANDASVCYRHSCYQDIRDNDRGFRVCRSVN